MFPPGSKVTFITLDLQGDLNLRIREELACLVGHFQFGQQSFGCRVDRPGRPDHPRRKFVPRNLPDCHVGLGTYFHKFREGFWYVDVQTKRRNPCHPEKLGSRAQGNDMHDGAPSFIREPLNFESPQCVSSRHSILRNY